MSLYMMQNVLEQNSETKFPFLLLMQFPRIHWAWQTTTWNSEMSPHSNFALSSVAFSYHLLAARGTCARADVIPLRLKAGARTESFILLFLRACKGCGDFLNNWNLLDRFWTCLKIKSILKSQGKYSQKASPRTLNTFGPCTWRNSKSTVERSFLAGYWSIIFITNIGTNRREKGVKGNTTKAGYIMMIQKIDLDVLPLTYT